MDRQQLEQEAITCISRGNLEGALRAYQGVLRIDGKDKRVRQKVGELLLKLGRAREAETQFRDVMEALTKEGNHRAAVAVGKQLLGIRQDDPVLHLEVADGYVASGYPNDARAHLDQAMRLWLSGGKPFEAAKAAQRLADLAPGELILRLKAAELYEGAGDGARALACYRQAQEEYRRRGRVDEVGRIAEIVLKLVPADLDALLDAARARVDGGDPRRGLTHLQAAYQAHPSDPRVLDLLARAFDAAQQPDKAARVLLKLVEVAAERGDAGAEADALRRAARLLPDDTSVRERLAVAERRHAEMERRLTGLVLSQPADETELEALVRAEVYLRYRYADRAESALRAALAARPGSPALQAALAEALVALGNVPEALGLMQGLLATAGGEAAAVAARMEVVAGAGAPPAAPAGEGPEARGDRLAAAGDVAGAVAAWREALAADPLDDRVLAKIADVRNRARETAPPVVDDDGTYAEVSPDMLEEASTPGDDMLEEARSLVSIGMYADAIQLLEGRTSLAAIVVLAVAHKGRGDVNTALDLLRSGTNDANDADPAYAEALFELAGLYGATGKQRAAVRLLEEVTELAPEFRTAEVEMRLRALRKL